MVGLAELLRDRYEPIERIGAGGQGEVWRALDRQHGRTVALKVRSVLGRDGREALLSEARMLLGMRPHEGLPLVRDDFFWDDRYVVVMDWVDGIDLDRLRREQGDPGLPISSVLAYLEQVARALDHLHAHTTPIIHGDVKPANLVLTSEGRVVLVDFGVAGFAGTVDVAGSVTHAFVAPEVKGGAPPSTASDIYGLAATALALITGQGPEEEEGDGGVVLDRSVRRALRRGLSDDAARRPRTAAELVERLSSWRAADLPTGTVTFLMTDVEGSSALWEAHTAVMDRVIERHDDIWSDAVEDAGGRFVRSRREGDSTLSVFVRARDALIAALRAQEQMRVEDWPNGIQLRVRAGVHTGETELSDGDYLGPTINRAARIRSLAPGGATYLSQATAQLVADNLPPDMSLDTMGTHELRGMERAETVFEVRRGGSRETEDRSPGIDRVPLPVSIEVAANFVGRKTEIGQLGDALDQAMSGEGRFVFLVGEPGIGKTTLAAHAARGAHARGATVLFGRCDEDSMASYQPFAEALTAYVRARSPRAIRELMGPRVQYLARLVPELATDMRPQGHVSLGESEGERFRLFDAVSTLLRSLASDLPVVLILDDLHWADKPTLLLLRHVIRESRKAKLVVCGTYRDTDVTRAHPLAAMLADLRRAEGFLRLHLSGLSRDDIAALLGAASSMAPSDALVDALLEETEGNPLFLREIAQHLIETGALERLGSQPGVAEIHELGIPEGVKDVIGRRLERLSGSANRLLSVASVVGRGFDLNLIQHVVDVPLDEILDGLDEATISGLLVEVSGRPDHYSFSHALVRECLYEELSTARRVRLHRTVASTIERLHGEDPAYLTEIAHHLFESAGAGDPQEAVRYFMMAADHADAKLAYEESIAHLERALESFDLIDRPELRARCRVLLRLAEQHWRVGEFDRSRQRYEEAARIASSEDLAEELARAAIGLGGWSTAYDAALVDETWIAWLEAALDALDEGDGSLRAIAMARLSEALLYQVPDRLERRTALARDAIAMARRLDDPQTLATVLFRAQSGLSTPGAEEQRLAMIDEARGYALEIGDLSLVTDADSAASCLLLELGRFEEASRTFALWFEEAEQSRQSYLQWVAMTDRSLLAFVRGDFGEAARRARDAVEIGEAAQNPNAIQSYAVQMLLWHWEADRMAEIASVGRAFAADYPSIPGYRAVLVMTGIVDPIEGREIFDALAADDFSSIPRNTSWLITMVVLAEASAMLEDAPYAAQLYDQLLPYADLWPTAVKNVVTFGCVHRLLGLLAARLGRWDDAERHFAAAMRANAPSPPWVAHTLHDHGWTLLRHGPPGERARAVDLLSRALEVAESKEMTRIASRCRAFLDEATGRTVDQDKRERLRPGLIEQARTVMTSGARGALSRLVRGSTDEELDRRFGSSAALGALFGAMARSFRPSRAFGFEGSISFEVMRAAATPVAGDWWTITVVGRKATAARGRVDAPVATVHVAVPDLIRLVAGELNPVAAVIQRRTRVDGDLLVAGRITDLFGGSAPIDLVADG